MDEYSVLIVVLSIILFAILIYLLYKDKFVLKNALLRDKKKLISEYFITLNFKEESIKHELNNLVAILQFSTDDLEDYLDTHNLLDKELNEILDRQNTTIKRMINTTKSINSPQKDINFDLFYLEPTLTKIINSIIQSNTLDIKAIKLLDTSNNPLVSGNIYNFYRKILDLIVIKEALSEPYFFLECVIDHNKLYINLYNKDKAILKTSNLSDVCKIIDNKNQKTTDIESSSNSGDSLKDLRKLEALIIDDEIDLLKIIERYLTSKNIAVDTAKNGTNAMEKIKNKQYNLILIDHKMPDMSGCKVLNVSANSVDLSNTYIYLMTGDLKPDDSDCEVLKKILTFKGFLNKPFDKEDLDKILAFIQNDSYLKENID